MKFEREGRRDTTLWILASGLLLGLAASVLYGARKRHGRVAAPTELKRLEDSVLEALHSDARLRSRTIDVVAIAPGIIELTGLVETEEEAHQAVTTARTAHGVSTVLNRLDARQTEQRLRPRSRAEAAANSRWYGMNAGMGQRRQAWATDPDRRDDRTDMLDEALAPDPGRALADLSEERIEKRAG